MKIERPKQLDEVLNEKGEFVIPKVSNNELDKVYDDAKVKCISQNDVIPTEVIYAKTNVMGILDGNLDRMNSLKLENESYISSLESEIQETIKYNNYITSEINKLLEIKEVIFKQMNVKKEKISKVDDEGDFKPIPLQ